MMKSKIVLVLIYIQLFMLSAMAQKHGNRNDLIGVNGAVGFYQPTPEGCVFIPPGSAEVDGKVLTFQAFYMTATEVTNGQYQNFLNDLVKQGKTKDYEMAKIDTVFWLKTDVGGAAAFAATYHKQKDLPVVNMSKEGAKLYCQWLTEQYRVKNDYKVSTEFRLPTKSEWEYAARGGINNDLHPWGRLVVKTKAGYLAQFKVIGQVLGPVKVKTFPANNFGLYDMAGNVAEMVSDSNIVKGGSWNSNDEKIQIQSEEPYEVSPTTGFRPVITFFTGEKDK
jgi:formylglycine-generating enzyme required for sulfatase activity